MQFREAQGTAKKDKYMKNKVTTNKEEKSDLNSILKVYPRRDGPHPEVVQYWGNPWDRRSKLHSESRVSKIDVISWEHCSHTRYYTRKNSYFYLILAKRPRSDSLARFAFIIYTFLPSNRLGCCIATC